MTTKAYSRIKRLIVLLWTSVLIWVTGCSTAYQSSGVAETINNYYFPSHSNDVPASAIDIKWCTTQKEKLFSKILTRAES